MGTHALATETLLHKRARKLRKLATHHGIGNLYCGGDGILIADIGPETPHFCVAGFATDAAEVLGADVDLLAADNLTGHHVPDQVRRPHPL